MTRRLLRAATAAMLTALLGGLTAATLVRLAPGFGVDERELDIRLSEHTKHEIRAASDRESVLQYYWQFLARAARGDLGFSKSFRRPAAELIAERFPETARAAGVGLSCGWILGMLLALAAVAVTGRAFKAAAAAVTAVFLCLPSSAMALAFVMFGTMEGRTAAACVIALVVFPRVFRYAQSLLTAVAEEPHVLVARSKGVGRWRILLNHVLRPAASPLVALLSVSVSVAFAAAIPAEVICDVPGLGQLAWQAALKRDLPLVADITTLVTLVTSTAGLLTGAAGACGRRAA